MIFGYFISELTVKLDVWPHFQFRIYILRNRSNTN